MPFPEPILPMVLLIMIIAFVITTCLNRGTLGTAPHASPPQPANSGSNP